MEIERQRIADALPAYDIGDVLGQGGWGVVLAGRHRHLDRRVAIKQLPTAFAADIAARRRFTAEARVLASLDHPHVVPVYDFVEREDLCLLVMELLPGGTLRNRFTTVGFTAPQAVAVALACAAGLNAAHERGVLHRDVKPENMLLAASGAIKVTDFGIAKVVGGADTMLTRVGDVVGTPSYIAPEQVRGQKLSPATDVYGLATMLYELLAGILPFTDDGDAMALLFRHAYEAPIPLRDVAARVPDPVAAVVMRGLATEPDDRFPAAESFGVALAEAGTRAWGPGWLSAQGMPILLGAERIVAPTRATTTAPDTPPTPRSNPPGTRPPAADGSAPITAAPRQPTFVTVRPGGAAPPQRPDAEADGHNAPADLAATARAADPASSSAPDAGAQAQPTAGSSAELHGEAGPSAPSPRRRMLVVAIILAVILIAIAAILLLPRLFTVYSTAVGSIAAPLLETAQREGPRRSPRTARMRRA